MIKETLRRFDERLDIDLFIPDQEDDGQDLMAQLTQMQQQFAALQEESQGLKEAADANKVKVQTTSETNQVNKESKIETAKIDNEAKVIIERERNVSNERIAQITAGMKPTDPNTPEPEPTIPATAEDINNAISSIAPMIEKVLATYLGADVVPERDQTGKIVRMRREIRTEPMTMQ